MSSAPIGIFDSGLGGLTVWKACKRRLPQEQFVYIADHAHCPYGPQSLAKIRKLCQSMVEHLCEQKVKLIIIACNTATAAAIYDLRQRYEIPFVGMEPAIKPAAKQSKTQKVGILATAGTFQGEHFKQTKAKYAGSVEVLIQIGEGLVELVESGKIEGEEAEELLKKYLDPMKEQGIDQLVLGCTHYPFLMNPIQRIMGPGVQIIDPAPAVAQQVERVLKKERLLNRAPEHPEDIFFTSREASIDKKSLSILSQFLEEEIHLEKLT